MSSDEPSKATITATAVSPFEHVGPTRTPIWHHGLLNHEGEMETILRVCRQCFRPVVTVFCDGTYRYEKFRLCESHKTLDEKLIDPEAMKWMSELIRYILIEFKRFPKKLLTFESEKSGKIILDVKKKDIIDLIKQILPTEMSETLPFHHAPGCYNSDKPEIFMQQIGDKPCMIKDVHYKLCNGTLLNAEGIMLARKMTNHLGVVGKDRPPNTDRGGLFTREEFVTDDIRNVDSPVCKIQFAENASDEVYYMICDIVSLIPDEVDFEMDIDGDDDG